MKENNGKKISTKEIEFEKDISNKEEKIKNGKVKEYNYDDILIFDGE